MKDKIIIIEDDTCVCCGLPVPFGQMICSDCASGMKRYSGDRIIKANKEQEKKRGTQREKGTDDH